MKLSYFTALLLLTACSTDTDKRYTGWQVTGGTKENFRYSSLTQIDSFNVKQLQVACIIQSMPTR
jgi:quinoprotein glucose dehydrogenase